MEALGITSLKQNLPINTSEGKLKGSCSLNYTSNLAELGITPCLHLNEYKNCHLPILP